MAAHRAEETVRRLFKEAGIQIYGKNPWDIQVKDSRFYERVLRDASLGLGESYVDGWWEVESIDGMVERMLRARLDKKVRGDVRALMPALLGRLTNRQAPSRAFEVGEEHYDLGNDLYTAMLDRRLNYACAYWKNASNLDEAQEAKLDLVCRKIGLQPGMHVLELGCGWGAFAKYAAEKYGVSVVGVTVSKEQVALGSEWVKGLPVELRLQDYRTVEGRYDRVISIGMMEHVGYKNYRTYMEVVDRTLKPDGVGFIQTIGGNESQTAGDPWSDRYIFPNGMLPSIAQLGAAMEGLFVMEDWHNFGPDYERTLLAWHDNFEAAWPELSKKYSERFHRMWRYYLLNSAGAFRARSQQLWQIVFTRTGTPQPDSRVG
ncbi:cyclopropane-fatty-acyl-phospholipid synthase [Longilinea arvoryzae]|uniref:Cyclopropane-fatty-acyl-phospholipid synthase n=1 Tax=Longilinea arvoryzae TaxID=360412 RepID=A0A0K8MXM2_9CHLR|nr:cyclopropane fatty acyl phospholipid synthase [Longilinea arvoryzae]GAP15950.1 cyclopropane-fatty-acyl-phospholipid synthase [Longilinea arvoryzae]